MADIKQTESDPKGQLFDIIEETKAVMLGSPDPTQHMQPMGAMVARDEEQIWFFTKTDSELVAALNGGSHNVHMCVVGNKGDYHACLHGALVVNKSHDHIERFWNSVVAAWFENGKQDENMTMLCFKPDNARIWASTEGALNFGWEVAKANMTGSDPDVGVTKNINF